PLEGRPGAVRARQPGRGLRVDDRAARAHRRDRAAPARVTLRDGRPAGVTILGPRVDGSDSVLTPDALAFVAHLHRSFGPVRAALLERRVERGPEVGGGAGWGVRREPAAIRHDGSWRVAETPPDLLD